MSHRYGDKDDDIDDDDGGGGGGDRWSTFETFIIGKIYEYYS